MVVPDATHRTAYDELRELYRELYPATAEIVHRLAALQTPKSVAR
jgi:hypothetical protein